MVWSRVQRRLNGRQAVRNHRGWNWQGHDEISDDASLLKLLITLMTDLGDRAKACRAQPWRSPQLLPHRSLQLGCGQRQNCRCSQVSGRPCTLVIAMLTIKLLKMHRSVKGFTPEHYSLPTSAGDLALITAIGDSVELAYHKSRLGGTVTLLPTKVGASQCNVLCCVQ